MGNETPRQGDALGLAAGHLAGAVALHAFEIEAFEPAPRHLERLVSMHSAEQQRQRDILFCRQFRHELAELEDETEAIAPQTGALRLPHGVDALVVEVDRTRVRDEDAGEAVEER